VAHPLTRASTIGPIAEMIETLGGSVKRVFREAGLPLRLIEKPDYLILLGDQFRLVESAARDVGDDAFSARLSMTAGIAGLGPYGHLFLSFDTLRTAIAGAYRDYAHLLQASTAMELAISAGKARWSYKITAPIAIGRQKNELLALGYMVQMVRHFAGPGWAPERIEVPGRLEGRRQIEAIYSASMSAGEEAAIIFPADLLDLPNRGRRPGSPASSELIPGQSDFPRLIAHLIRLSLLEARPNVDDIAARLGTARRTLQRRLEACDCSFDDLKQSVMSKIARDLLRDSTLSLTDIAYELGYSDPAHFSRAFRRETGKSPRDWRADETSRSAFPQ